MMDRERSLQTQTRIKPYENRKNPAHLLNGQEWAEVGLLFLVGNEPRFKGHPSLGPAGAGTLPLQCPRLSGSGAGTTAGCKTTRISTQRCQLPEMQGIGHCRSFKMLQLDFFPCSQILLLQITNNIITPKKLIFFLMCGHIKTFKISQLLQRI